MSNEAVRVGARTDSAPAPAQDVRQQPARPRREPPPPPADATPGMRETSLDVRVTAEGDIRVRVVDQSSGEVLREIPPESLQEALHPEPVRPGMVFDAAA